MRNHRSLLAWQEAHTLVNLVLDLARDYWKPHLAAVYRQLSSAAISVQINIAEGYGLGTQPLLLRHLRIAYGSAVEAGDLIDLLVIRGELPSTEIAAKAQQASQRSQRLLLGLMRRYKPAQSE